MKNTKTFGSRIIGLVAILACTIAAIWAANSYFAGRVSSSPHFAETYTAFPASDDNLTADCGDQASRNLSPHSVAFQSNRDGNNEIYVMNADGSDQIRLTCDA